MHVEVGRYWLFNRAPPVFCIISESFDLPSRELTYPTWQKGKSSSKCHFWGDMLVPWRAAFYLQRLGRLGNTDPVDPTSRLHSDAVKA